MLRVRWDIEEAVALFDLYFRNLENRNISIEELERLSAMYYRRAIELKINTDEKFRNISGLRMQLGCIHYVVTEGKAGMSGASKLFYDTYELYKKEPEVFRDILTDFYRKYSV